MRYLAPLLLLLLACHPGASGESRERGPVTPSAPDPGPVVDEACLQLARDGKLIASQPREAAGFTVTPTEHGVQMVRNGRALTEEEGTRLWNLFSKDYFSRGGMSSGSSAISSVYKCDGIGDASCLKLDVYVCQKDIATIATWASEAAAAIGAPDGELALKLGFMERGPSCKDGAACPPKVHYSTKNGRYESDGPRNLATRGRGRCTNDGDCEGGGNTCIAWHLAGGVETAIYIQYGVPTFCGCIENTCNWFTQ